MNSNHIITAIDPIKEAEFVSVWDGGFAVATSCKVNMVTKEVFDISRRQLLIYFCCDTYMA